MANKTFSNNGRVQGDRNFGFSIVPAQPMADQVRAQVVGIDATKDETVVLHPIPGVGASTVAFLRGRNNTFPTISLVGPDGVARGEFDLHNFRHNVVRPERKAFLTTADALADNAIIVVNSSGRAVEDHQMAELKQLTGSENLVVATLQLGQVELGREDLGQWLLETLVAALKAAKVGNSIASRRVVAITGGLSPVNAIIMTALQGLCESWGSQPVAENQGGVFHFTDLIRLAEMEDLGRTTAAAIAPVLVSREEIAAMSQRVIETLEGRGEVSIPNRLREVNDWLKVLLQK